MKLRHLFLFCVICCSVSISAQNKSKLPKTSGNPIFPGWYADPEGIVFGDEYWIYPTYSAAYDDQIFMDAFSSKDLVNWTKHPKVLSKENISWLRRALWAPAVIHANDKFDQQKFYDHLSKIAFPNRRNPINIFIAANDRIAQWTSLFAKVKTSYNNGFSFIYPSINESNKISQKSLTINALYSKYLLGCSTYNIQKDIAGNTYQEPHTQNMLFFFDEITVNNFRYAWSMFKYYQLQGAG